jgi:hypothetical protein
MVAGMAFYVACAAAMVALAAAVRHRLAAGG